MKARSKKDHVSRIDVPISFILAVLAMLSLATLMRDALAR